ncbi:hypothetical protein BB561_002301 [Smittium simulii]|uniref:Uncharacterized protein n=1 Tax=Smittium simulii TaxID=133385 RepID=A0A2T9YR03_9FUNG|nr:hypothetical protein BB561_002301 [Smittium simulii]
MIEDFYHQITTGRVSSVCWLPPEAGLSYNDPDLLFLTGTSGSNQEISFWSIKNPDFAQNNATPLEFDICEIGSLQHKGDVNCIQPHGTDGVLTGSSNGTINYFKLIVSC